MRKPTYPRIEDRNVTIKTKKGYVTYYGCKDINNYKKTCLFKVGPSSDNIWYMKSNKDRVIIDRFIYEDKKIKATVKVFYTKNWHYIKWVSGKIDRLDRVEIECNKWRTNKKVPTPFTSTGYYNNLVRGGCTVKQAIKWVRSLAHEKTNIRKYNKAIKEAA